MVLLKACGNFDLKATGSNPAAGKPCMHGFTTVESLQSSTYAGIQMILVAYGVDALPCSGSKFKNCEDNYVLFILYR